MSNLQAFLNPVYTVKKVTVVLSDRFIDPETGEPGKITLKSLPYEQLEAMKKRCYDSNGKLDSAKFAGYCIAESSIDPDFHSKEICTKFGTMDPAQVPLKIFDVGEFNQLMDAFQKLNGIDNGIASIGEITKN